MKMMLVDKKKNELMQFTVEIDRYMFIVKGLAVNKHFKYLENRIMNIRKERMKQYLNCKEYDNTDIGYKTIEYDLINDIQTIVEDEIHKYNEELGIHLYLVKVYEDEEEE